MVYLVKTLLRQKFFQQPTMSLFLTVFLSVFFLTTGCRRQDDRLSQEIFTVRKAPLDITVLASGNLTTRDSVIITQQVGRSAKILEIVEEGTVITQTDIDEKRVLVKFDSRDLEDEVYSRQTALESAQSSELAAHEDLDVQESSNESAIRKAEQEVLRERFATQCTVARICPFCCHKVELLYRGTHGPNRLKCPNCGEEVIFPPLTFRRSH